MKKFLSKAAIAFGAIGAFLGINSAHAAADADLTAALASSSNIVSDNMGGILGYIVGIWGKGFLVGLILAALGLTAAIVIGFIYRRKKRR